MSNDGTQAGGPPTGPRPGPPRVGTGTGNCSNPGYPSTQWGPRALPARVNLSNGPTTTATSSPPPITSGPRTPAME